MSNFTVSDLYFSGEQISETDFSQMIARIGPVGYTNFARLIPGDYLYQKALVKVSVFANASERLQIDQLKLTVDLPDLQDRNVSAVGTTITTVTFGRSFNAPPHVTASLKSGTTGVTLKISNITSTSFDVEIFDSVGNPVAGTISWVAVGY